jgi:hypothetical protein
MIFKKDRYCVLFHVLLSGVPDHEKSTNVSLKIFLFDLDISVKALKTLLDMFHVFICV